MIDYELDAGRPLSEDPSDGTLFPDPYPDELLYSACARYADRVRYVNKQSVREELLGKIGCSVIIDFPSHLQFLSRMIPNNNYSVDELISENTLLPFFEPFLPCDRAEIVRQEMSKSSETNKISARLEIRVKQVRPPDYLRFCPLCVKNDREQYGEIYWHRLHLITGVIICPLHRCFLENSLLRWGKESRSSFQVAEENIFQIEPN